MERTCRPIHLSLSSTKPFGPIERKSSAISRLERSGVGFELGLVEFVLERGTVSSTVVLSAIAWASLPSFPESPGLKTMSQATTINSSAIRRIPHDQRRQLARCFHSVAGFDCLLRAIAVRL